MCGIIGVLFFKKPEDITNEIRRESAIVLITELLQLTQQRGKDATGITTLFNDGDYIGLKMGIPAMEFITGFDKKETDYTGFLDLWRHVEENESIKAQAFLGHCRKSSVGNYWDNNNNHPIRIGNIVGVHNGTLTNHDKIFENLGCKRDGEVDSEAIFRLLSHFTEEGKNPFSKSVITEVAKRLQGTYAVLTYNADNPYQVAAFRDGKPIEMAFIKPLNMVVLASEEKYLKQAIFRLIKQAKIYKTSIPESVNITLSNTEFKMMPDDSMCIFDLDTEIESKTSITDLYISEKITRSDKIWSANSTVTKTYSAPTTPIYSTADKSDKTTTAANKTAGPDEKGVAKIWNKEAGKFVPAENEVDKDKNIGNVDVNIDNNSITKISSSTTVEDQGDGEAVKKEDNHPTTKPGPETKFELTEAVSIENLIGVKEASVDEKRVKSKTQNVIDVDFKVIKKSSQPIVSESTEVDLSVDPEALQAAEEAYKNIARFKNADDVAANLQLESAKVIDALPVYAFANRIQSFAFKLGFVRGFMSKSTVGKSEATETIRRFKLVSMCIAKVLDSLTVDINTKERVMDEEFNNVLVQRKDLNYETLTTMYSAGDMRKSLTLARLVQQAQRLFGKNKTV